MLLPVGGLNLNVAPLTKLFPLIVNVCLLVDPGILDGETLLIEGAGDVDVTVKLS